MRGVASSVAQPAQQRPLGRRRAAAKSSSGVGACWRCANHHIRNAGPGRGTEGRPSAASLMANHQRNKTAAEINGHRHQSEGLAGNAPATAGPPTLEANELRATTMADGDSAEGVAEAALGNHAYRRGRLACRCLPGERRAEPRRCAAAPRRARCCECAIASIMKRHHVSIATSSAGSIAFE